MRQQFSNLDTWRGKLTATWVCLAPPAALVAVFVAGGVPSNQLVVDPSALSQPRQDALFDDLAGEVPTQPGVDGSIGTEKRSKIGVPVTGTTDGKPLSTPGPGVGGDASGIPTTVLAAYQRAATELAATQPGCGITWPLLAGIGKVESGHASGGRVDATGLTRGPILGPVLDGGPGMAAISDTDQGRYDGNTRWDRAVGPMQFIPGTWATFGADGNGDGVKDPHNVFDAARAAAEYLCAGGADLRSPQGLVQAVLRYNHSMDYVSTVLLWMQSYSNSTVTIPDTTGVVPQPTGNDGNVQKDDDPTRVPVPTNDQTPDPVTTSAAPTQSPHTTSPVSTPTRTTTHPLPVKPPTKTKPPWTLPLSPAPTRKPSSPTSTSPTPTSPTPTSPTPTELRPPTTSPTRTTSSTPPTTPPTTPQAPLPPCGTPEPTPAPAPMPTPTCIPASSDAPSVVDSSQPAS